MCHSPIVMQLCRDLLVMHQLPGSAISPSVGAEKHMIARLDNIAENAHPTLNRRT